MSKSFNTIRATVLAILASAILAGCGGGGNDTPPAPQGPTAVAKLDMVTFDCPVLPVLLAGSKNVPFICGYYKATGGMTISRIPVNVAGKAIDKALTRVHIALLSDKSPTGWADMTDLYDFSSGSLTLRPDIVMKDGDVIAFQIRADAPFNYGQTTGTQVGVVLGKAEVTYDKTVYASATVPQAGIQSPVYTVEQVGRAVVLNNFTVTQYPPVVSSQVFLSAGVTNPNGLQMQPRYSLWLSSADFSPSQFTSECLGNVSLRVTDNLTGFAQELPGVTAGYYYTFDGLVPIPAGRTVTTEVIASAGYCSLGGSVNLYLQVESVYPALDLPWSEYNGVTTTLTIPGPRG